MHLQCGQDFLSQLLTGISINVCESSGYPPLQPVGIDLLWVQPFFPLILASIHVPACLHLTRPSKFILTLLLVILQTKHAGENVFSPKLAEGCLAMKVLLFVAL